MTDKPTSRTITGHTVTFLIAPTNVQTALGPALSMLCGALASGNWQWQVDRLLDLVLVLFIAELLWSSWRAILIDMDWPSYIAAHPLPESGDAVLMPPYTTPWSHVGRLFARWARLRRWMRQTLPVERASALLTLPILPPVIIVLSATISTPILMLSVAVLALTTMEWRLARIGKKASASLRASVEIGASWLAGHLVFGQLTWPSLALATCYALVYQGTLCLASADGRFPVVLNRRATAVHPRDLGSARRLWALLLIYGGQAAALALLVALGHPLAAIALGLFGAPQLLLAPLRVTSPLDTTDGRNLWYLRHSAPFLILSMVVAAWAIADTIHPAYTIHP